MTGGVCVTSLILERKLITDSLRKVSLRWRWTWQ